jgi:hypothetical protein
LSVGSNVNDAKDGRRHGFGRQKALHDLVNPQIVLPNLWTGRVKANDTFLGTNFAKHGQHILQVIVIQIKDRLIIAELAQREREREKYEK